MLDVFEALDLAEHDSYLQGYRTAYVRGDIDVLTLEESIAERLDEIQRSDGPNLINGKQATRWLDEAINADLDRLAALKSSPYDVARLRHKAHIERQNG